MKKKRLSKESIVGFTGSILFSLCCIGTFSPLQQAAAGETMPLSTIDSQSLQSKEVSSMDLELIGATDIGTVQLFGHLISEIPGVISVQPIFMHIQVNNKSMCKTVWNVKKIDNTFEMTHELAIMINRLEIDKQNASLYESPFIVMQEDIEQVKKARILQQSHTQVTFSIENVLQGNNMYNSTYAIAENPWMQIHGAGFE